MYKIVTVAAAVACLAVPAVAQNSRVFDQPCNRGPMPHWAIINETHTAFIDFIQEVRPKMPRDQASYIAYQVCSDMSIVGNSEELTKRLNLLIRKSGY
ncbi:hypothetical protein M3484_20965 [Pseudomonas sp. GX19020]|uniref:hypothetical protein n=1 Tax=Pseudomonadota TaxID=1224 RepID=UPI0008980B80|nr:MULTISPECIES: hypothetical protein [Pseudomonadota]MCL4069032.1 hypothetical protein [Pseudomonas sp. GX19020]SEB46791.1 hypothetical protein SAMN05519105_0408 [Rhodobacter sp. 24-YEA-8]